VDTSLETSQIDRRYHDLKIPNPKREKEILASVSEKGLLEALGGIRANGAFILLDGFKRLKACEKLGILQVVVCEWRMDEASALLLLLKGSITKSLHIFEEAKIVIQLQKEHHLTSREIADQLNRSTGWVSTRINFLNETSSFVLEKVFSGQFPATSAAYALRQFKRLNKVSGVEIDIFVKATSGKNLSTRDIDLLAKRYFLGGDEAKKNITEGRLGNFLSSPKRSDVPVSNQESDVLNDLEIIRKYMDRLCLKLPQRKSSSSNFNSMASTFLEGISGKLSKFTSVIQQGLKEFKCD